jgi:hypothetical protein
MRSMIELRESVGADDPVEIFVASGLAEVEVYVNDKATAIFPPYGAGAQRTFADGARDRVRRRIGTWSEIETRRFFLAGGGSEDAFDARFASALASREKIVRGLDAGTYHGISGGPFYFVAGRKKTVGTPSADPDSKA